MWGKPCRRRRGWPVVATGTSEVDCPREYAAWKRNYRIPEDTPDFSDRDVFDMLELCLERQRYEDAAPGEKPELRCEDE